MGVLEWLFNLVRCLKPQPKVIFLHADHCRTNCLGDLLFTGDFPISVWAKAARQAGSIRAAERILYRAARTKASGM